LPNPQPFGRREAVIALTPARPLAPPAAHAPQPDSPQVEAFRAELARSRDGDGDSFAAWRRSQRGEAVLTWAAAIAFASPGLLCLLLQAPLALSIGLEVAGFAANAWVRRQRRRRLKAIVAWGDSAEV
jgi:hypothetical protein